MMAASATLQLCGFGSAVALKAALVVLHTTRGQIDLGAPALCHIAVLDTTRASHIRCMEQASGLMLQILIDASLEASRGIAYTLGTSC